MANFLAGLLGVELEIVDTNMAGIIPELMHGRFDIIMADIFATPVRARTLIFTEPYHQLGLSVVVGEDFTGSTWEDLNKPDVVIANLSRAAATNIIDKEFAEVERKDIVSDSICSLHLEVAAGRADAITDHVSNVACLQEHPDAKLRILNDEERYSTKFAYAVRPDDGVLLEFLNTWIRYRRSTGELDRLRMTCYGY